MQSRTIKVIAFDDDSYPFKKGEWEIFEKTNFPSIEKIEMNKVIQKGEEFTLTVETRNSDSILYFLTDSQKGKITSRVQNIDSPTTIISISSEESSQLNTGIVN
jgi:peptide/nickel transport system substrate-binding protein